MLHCRDMCLFLWDDMLLEPIAYIQQVPHLTSWIGSEEVRIHVKLRNQLFLLYFFYFTFLSHQVFNETTVFENLLFKRNLRDGL